MIAAALSVCVVAGLGAAALRRCHERAVARALEESKAFQAEHEKTHRHAYDHSLRQRAIRERAAHTLAAKGHRVPKSLRGKP